MNRIAMTIALAAGIACAAFGYEPQRHNDAFTTNGVTYAQRGGLGASDYVVTNIDASAVGKVQSVNGKTGDVVLNAQDVGAATAEQGDKADTAVQPADLDQLLIAQYYPEGNVTNVNQITTEGLICELNNDGTAMVTGYTGNATDIVIPWKTVIGGVEREVTKIINFVFDGKSIISVVAPTTVTFIGGNVFSSCSSLKNVSLPSVTAIGPGAFLECVSLTDVSLPLVTTIGYSAFYSCTSLKNVSLPSATSVGNFVFYNCSALTSVSLPSATTIGDRVFVGCTSLASVDFGSTPRNTVPTLDSGDFSGVPTSCKIIIPLGMYDAWIAADEWKDLYAAGYQFMGYADAADMAEVEEDNAQTRQIVATWENFLDGSNVVFSITNYISGTYNLDAAKLRISELRDGSYREVYNSRDEILLHIKDFKDGDFTEATNQLVGVVNSAVESKADKNWGKYTSAGGIAPENTVYMTAPNTVFAGGLEYERVAVGEGTICVLTTKGAPVWTQGDEGTFKFQDDGGTNFFGFAKTDSYTIGANTDGITVQGGMVTLTYSITMSGRPCVWYKASLTDGSAWEQLNLADGSAVAGASHAVTWEQNPPADSQVCYINVGNAPVGFFRATVEVAGSAKFMTNMPAEFEKGILCPNTATGVEGVIKPQFNGTTVEWVWSEK